MNEPLLKKILNENQNLKYFHILSVLYLFGIMTSLTVSARLLTIHIPIINSNILLTAGTWTIPFTFFIQDITTEVYGYAKSKQLILIALPVIILYISYLKLTTFFPIPEVHNISQSYNDVCNALPRHLLAFVIAITIGNLVNNLLLHKLKHYFKGRYLPIRFISSTAVGEAVLQLIGTTVAWFENLNFSNEILPFILFSYAYKITFEAFMTPFNIYICGWLKTSEGIDIY